MRKVVITELAFRDGHQSLLATRMKTDDMLNIAEAVDNVGFHSVESWGGATFDACIRYLNEDPFKRLSLLKEVMPKTPQQMLIRGQNLLGYRHYADDLVDKFIERSVRHGMDIFRIFDALNDTRNLKQSINAVIKQGSHAQGTLCYTTSPYHNTEYWINLAHELKSMGCHSLCIKDMSGILVPQTGFNLIKALKESVDIPIHLHSHATSGLASMTLLKAVEAGVDGIDTAISPLSMTYSHSATEAMISAIEDYDDLTTEIDLAKLLPIAKHFKEVRKKYAKFEGELKGVDARIIHSQIPGGMLTNLESQLAEANLIDRLDEVIDEIPRVREDLGYIPLVTPTSQIVGTQSVINVSMNERYKNISKEVQALIKGEYGKVPGEFNPKLINRVLEGSEPISVRPADLLENELAEITRELKNLLIEKQVDIRGKIDIIDAVMIYALFPQVGLSFLENKFAINNHQDGSVNVVDKEKTPIDNSSNQSKELNKFINSTSNYQVQVNGENFEVIVKEGTDVIQSISSKNNPTNSILENSTQVLKQTLSNPNNANLEETKNVLAPLTGNVLRIEAQVGQAVKKSEVLIVLEAMKMEVEVKAEVAGVISAILVKVGDMVQTNQEIASIQ